MIRFVRFTNCAGRPVVAPVCTCCKQSASIYVSGHGRGLAVKCGCPK